MSYLGDFFRGCLIFDMFTTVTTTGAPTQLAGTPALSIYNDLNVTQTTAGITLAVDCDGVTGLNSWSVDTNLAAYDCGHDYKVVITTGTVGGTSVVGYVVAKFSLTNRSTLRPLIHGCNAVATTQTGAVRINWAEKENPAASQALSCTTIFSVHSIDNAVRAVEVADKTGYALSAAGVDAILDEAITEPTSVFAWASATLRNIIGWLGAVESNCMHQTACHVFMCSRDASSCIAFAAITCGDTYVMRGSFQSPA